MTDEYQITVIQSCPELLGIEREWRQFLAEGVQGNNLFNDPAHIALQLEKEPTLKLCVFIIRKQERICCVAPCYQQDFRLKLQFSVLTLMAWSVPTLKVFGGEFIIAADESSPRLCYAALFEFLERMRSQYGLLMVESLDVRTELWKFCSNELGLQGHFRCFLTSSQIDDVHQIRLPHTYEALMMSRSSKTNRNLRYYTRKLVQQRGARLERITEVSQVPIFLQHLDRVYRECWQGRRNGFHSRNTEAQLRYFSGLARQGWLRSYLLDGNDGPLAYVIGYQYDGVYYFYETGFDEASEDLSPGSVLLHLMLEDLFQNHTPQLFDFLLGDQAYKRSYSNTHHGAASLYLAPRNRWRFILGLQAGIFNVERLLRTILRKLKLDGAVRKALKHNA